MYAEDAPTPLALPLTSAVRGFDGDGAVTITGELRQWHKITLTLAGPFADECDADPNPFTDSRMTVRFTHESGSPAYDVPGYFAADGDAANSSATSGTTWRAHSAPDKPGLWTYRVSFVRGKDAAVGQDEGATPLSAYDGKTGTFRVLPTDKAGRDFRAGQAAVRRQALPAICWQRRVLSQGGARCAGNAAGLC